MPDTTSSLPSSPPLHLTFGVYQGDTLVRSESFPRAECIKIGSIESCHLRLDGASRLHAVIEVTSQGVSIVDLGSSPGTLVNGRAVAKAYLCSGDEIQLGPVRLVLTIAEAGASPCGLPSAPAPAPAPAAPRDIADLKTRLGLKLPAPPQPAPPPAAPGAPPPSSRAIAVCKAALRTLEGTGRAVEAARRLGRTLWTARSAYGLIAGIEGAWRHLRYGYSAAGAPATDAAHRALLEDRRQRAGAVPGCAAT